MAKCGVCFRHCEIKEGTSGLCGARICRCGEVVPGNYGRITSVALDPIEKKPLSRFCPGSMILSVGSYGCNLLCPFCQNFGNIGVAYTYNEPLIGYEFVRDTAKLVKTLGMKNVMVTNGTAELSVAEEILPFIDAMNIDIKCFSSDTYKNVLGGDLEMTKEFIERAAKSCHVELTCLIVPGMNDSEEELRELTRWIAGLKDSNGNTIGEGIPLHISRFFPRYKMTDRSPTPVSVIYDLADIARRDLKYVYTGNC